jgi:hypothetical protein
MACSTVQHVSFQSVDLLPEGCSASWTGVFENHQSTVIDCRLITVTFVSDVRLPDPGKPRHVSVTIKAYGDCDINASFVSVDELVGATEVHPLAFVLDTCLDGAWVAMDATVSLWMGTNEPDEPEGNEPGDAILRLASGDVVPFHATLMRSVLQGRSPMLNALSGDSTRDRMGRIIVDVPAAICAQGFDKACATAIRDFSHGGRFNVNRLDNRQVESLLQFADTMGLDSMDGHDTALVGKLLHVITNCYSDENKATELVNSHWDIVARSSFANSPWFKERCMLAADRMEIILTTRQDTRLRDRAEKARDLLKTHIKRVHAG